MDQSSPNDHTAGEPSAHVGLWQRRQLLGGAAGAILSLQGLSAQAALPDRAPVTTVDVLVIGSGAAGMTAALSARKRGLQALVIDKAAFFGGSTARSGGGIWIRNNSVLQQAGVVDTPALAARYLKAVVGEDVPQERLDAFLRHGPEMIDFLLAQTPLRFRWMQGYPDYYPELPGGQTGGASIEPDVFDGQLLGEELARLNPPYLKTPDGVVLFGGDYKWLNLAAVSAKGAAVALQSVDRYLKAQARRQKPLTMGQALAAGLRAGLLSAQVPVWLNTALQELVVDAGGRVSGATVLIDGQVQWIRARRGVVVCTGGFEHNEQMRQRYQPQPSSTEWTVGASTNTGDGIRAGVAAGAALGLMDDAWWGPSIRLPEGPRFLLAERSLPGGLLVNGLGQRFCNESAPYVDVVHQMYARNVRGSSLVTWLIVDQRFRNRYLFIDKLPLVALPKAWFDSGAVVKESTLDRLAQRIGVPAANLAQTVSRFNGFAKTGRDLDFKRGDSAYDRFYADPAVKPNPNLAPIDTAPYYAFRIVAGDLGTKGGLITDARARVLDPLGRAIPGLYAAGNASSAVMGRSYAGAGATLGPAMTFGYIAGQDLADAS